MARHYTKPQIVSATGDLLRTKRKRQRPSLKLKTEPVPEYESVSQMIGSMSQQHCPEPAAFERANYMKMLASYRPIN